MFATKENGQLECVQIISKTFPGSEFTNIWTEMYNEWFFKKIRNILCDTLYVEVRFSYLYKAFEKLAFKYIMKFPSLELQSDFLFLKNVFKH